MSNARIASMDHRSQVHTEVRRPMEAVVSRVVMFVFGVIEVLIAIRFVFTLLGANAEAGFVKFVHDLSGVFMAPFNAIFETQSVSGATFEWSALVAIAVYALIAWGIVALVRAASPRRRAETVERVEKVEKDDADAVV
ncbi:MAG: YggT family protein [Coriobacteriia bacterium]|nr:YggT family protein [Coriobacteriia bacterium]